MRALLAAAALAVPLTITPAAGASSLPPLPGLRSTLGALPVLKLKDAAVRPPSSCSAHARERPRGSVGRVERKLAPVACEQPPRSKLLSTGFTIVLAP